MATMRPLLQQFKLSWIAFWIAGALCGALLMIGISTLRQTSQDSTAPVVIVTTFTGTTVPVGGRLGGITSSDTATDWLIRQAITADSASQTAAFNPVGEGLTGWARHCRRNNRGSRYRRPSGRTAKLRCGE